MKDEVIEDITKYRPCGRFKKCKAAPGWCEDCTAFKIFLQLITLGEIEERLANGITVKEQKEAVKKAILRAKG